MRERLRAALMDALRSRDAGLTSAVRNALSALENAEAVPLDTLPPAGAMESAQVGVGAADAPRRVLSEQQERVMLDAEVAELRAAAEMYADMGDEARAADARRAADLLAAAALG